jgi:hypothetical protein
VLWVNCVGNSETSGIFIKHHRGRDVVSGVHISPGPPPSPRLLLIITDGGVRTSLEKIKHNLTRFCIHYGRVIYLVCFERQEIIY